MFNLRNFVRKTLIGMVGVEPEYKVRQYALGWFEKGVLEQDDLAELDAQYISTLNAQTEVEASEE